MRARSSATRGPEAIAAFLRRQALRGACTALAGALGIGCGPNDGVIGAEAGPTPSAKQPTFEAQFAGRDPIWQPEAGMPRGSATSGDENLGAEDGRVATLVFPGHPEYGPNDGVGAELATSLTSDREFGYGTYRSRVAFGSCASGEETTQAMLGYFSDGGDHDDNGLRDEVEIDFQVLCGSPSLAYMTVFTDYEERATGVEFRKLSHVVDFATGRTYDTPSASEEGFVEGVTDSSLVLDLFTPEAFYELGFEWRAGSIRFFIDVNGAEKTLWMLDDPARVPTGSVSLVYNAWHPESHWHPFAGAADYPANDVVLSIDWFRYYAE